MKPKILTKTQCNSLYREVAVRDNYQCILCGNLGNSIHHIVCRSGHVKGSAVIWQEQNMTTLCSECHHEAHQHPKEMRRRLLKRMQILYNYDYNCEPFKFYLTEEE